MSVLQDAAGRARQAAARGQMSLPWMPAAAPVTRSVLAGRGPSSRLGGLTVPAALDSPVPASIARSAVNTIQPMHGSGSAGSSHEPPRGVARTAAQPLPQPGGE